MKRFTKILTVAVAVSMVGASVVACSKSKKDEGVEGDYSGSYNMADKLLAGMGLSADLDSELLFDVTLELDDGKYVLNSDGEENYDELIDYITGDEVKDAILDEFGAQGMSEDDLNTMAQTYGYDTYDDYIVAMITSYMTADDLAMHEEGTYELDGDDITFTPDDDGEIGHGTFEDGEITIDFQGEDEMVFSK